MLTGNRQCFVKILGIQPWLGAHFLRRIILPQPRRFDIECALLSLIAGLNAESRHGPLPAHPINVAMQGHVLHLRKPAVA